MLHTLCERMIRGHLRSHPPAKYNVGEKVYVRLPRKGGIKNAAKRRYVLEAKILKRNIHRHVYKVAYISPVTLKKSEKWMPVDEITSLTLGEEKRKQRPARITKKRQEAHRRRYYIPMEQDDYQKVIEEQGFDIQYNPPGDGSCQFAALANQLSALGIFRSAETMREEIVRYLQTTTVDNEGFPLLEFLPEFNSWEQYLEYMARYNTFGDQITLFAAANLFNINIQVISTLGPGAEHLFEPSSSVPLGTVFLGHFAASEHYVSLVPWFCDSQDGGPECDGKSVQGSGSHSETDGDTREIDEIESDTAGVGGSRDIDGLRGRRVDRSRVGESDTDGVGGSSGNIDGVGGGSESIDGVGRSGEDTDGNGGSVGNI